MNETQERLFDEATDVWIERYENKTFRARKGKIGYRIYLEDTGETTRFWEFDEPHSTFIKQQLPKDSEVVFITERDSDGYEKQYIVIVEDGESRYGFVLDDTDSHTIEYGWGSMLNYLLSPPDTQILHKLEKAFPIVQETMKQIRKYRLYDATGMLDFVMFE